MTELRLYSELAEIYDRIMSHVDYNDWASYIFSILSRYGIKVKDVLEIACGTGNLSIILHKYGFNVTSTDLSYEMTSVAKNKFNSFKIPIKLFISNMASLPMKAKFDAVICLYDSVNYLLEPEHLSMAFNESAEVLKQGGVYIFDICTVKNSRLFFSNHVLSEDFGDIGYERTCRYHPKESLQENSFVITKGSEKIYEKHLQRIYKINDVKNLIPFEKFELLGIFDDMSFRAGSEDSERVHFILQRK